MSSSIHARRPPWQRALCGVLGGLLLTGLGSSCSASQADDAAGSVEMVDGGSWYVRHRWPHDGRPIESENFVVYSDAAGAEARRRTAEVAEEVLAETIAEMEIDPDTLRFPPGQDKIDVYAYHDHYLEDWAAGTYHVGMIVPSPDHPQRNTRIGGFEATIEHELVHVIQWLITGPDGAPVDVWFIEGLPEAMAGGTTGGAIRGRDQLDELTSEYGRTSPVSFKTYSEIADPDTSHHFYYPMFHLAVEYLLDDDGQGRSPADAAAVMIDVAKGASFDAAFEHHMGMALDDFEADFFSLMDGYLPRYHSPVFTPVGLSVVSVLVLAFVAGTLVLAARSWRTEAASGTVARAAPGRAAQIGFAAEITVAALVVVVFFLEAVFLVGTADVLYNESNTAELLWALSSLVGYLLVSVGVLLWSLHRWLHRSRWAFLVAPLVVVTTAATVFAAIVIF